MSNSPERPDIRTRLSRHENDNSVAALLREYLALALEWMSEGGLEKKADLVLRELERHLRSIPADTPGHSGTLSIVYGMMIARCEDRKDWGPVVDLGRKVLTVPGLSLTSAELHTFTLGRALCELSRPDEAAQVYVDGIRRAVEPDLWPGIAGLLLEMGNVMPFLSREVLNGVTNDLRQWVARDSNELAAFEAAVNESRLAAWARELAIRLRPQLEGSRRDMENRDRQDGRV